MAGTIGLAVMTMNRVLQRSDAKRDSRQMRHRQGWGVCGLEGRVP